MLGFIFLGVAGGLVGLLIWRRILRVEDRIEALTTPLDRRVEGLARELADIRASRVAPVATDSHRAPAGIPAVEIPPPPRAVPVREKAPAMTIAQRPAISPPTPTTTTAAPPAATAPPPAPPPAAPPMDFASTIGPRILVAAGALALMVFLGLFVKYAWDNNWVGPAGRVLMGAIFGLGLLALGIRIIRREYRPLGQGLAAAGVAGLYTSAFAAHGFYALVPREVSGLLMIAITASAVLLAVRLDARLLAALAWTGGYMTPLLLSTGEDRAVTLFLYLALLDAGALLIDQRKPWPETAPIAMTGTVLLYAGWYERFFRPERFEAAAFGLVLFTALFAFGMARKQRAGSLAAVISLGGIGVAVMAGGADRPLPLLALSMAIGVGALRASTTMGRGLAALALLVLALPFAVWWGSHYRPEAFGIAALWVVLAALVFILPAARAGAAAGHELEQSALIGASIASAALCAGTDRPLEIACFLAAMAGLAVLIRRRWPEAEMVGILAAALSVAVWMLRFFSPTRGADAYAIALPAIAVFAVALLVRALRARGPLGDPDTVAHLLFAAFTWWFFYTVLNATHPALKGPAAVAMAMAYLVLGLVARRHSDPDQRLVRIALGLAAGFLTLAIPIQLGRHGVTLAWAAEGVVLLALGTRFASVLTRAGGYGVLAMAVVRLVAVHTPIHPGAFVPVLNAAFGTWLAVVVALGAALWVTRGQRRGGHPLDAAAGPIVGGIAILLLFGALNGETRAIFAQRRIEADRLGDVATSQAARRVSALAVSVLWTLFATGLLAAGLAARNRALFYSAYGLFALTAGKVVLWDLEDFSVPYRMLAFLVLGLLLMAGAYLNLRFRQRLQPAAE